MSQFINSRATWTKEDEQVLFEAKKAFNSPNELWESTPQLKKNLL
jgi:hypothetical protein